MYESLISLSVACALIITIYSVGIWAGRHVEKEVEKNKIIQARLDKEALKKRR